jgi:hypothetical protein
MIKFKNREKLAIMGLFNSIKYMGFSENMHEVANVSANRE